MFFVYSAATQAVILPGDVPEKTQHLLALQIASHSFGIEVFSGLVAAVIGQNTTTPMNEFRNTLHLGRQLV